MKRLTLLLLLLSGCSSQKVIVSEAEYAKIQAKKHQERSEYIGQQIEKFDYEGHEYLMYDSYKPAGICHSETCHCRNTNE